MLHLLRNGVGNSKYRWLRVVGIVERLRGSLRISGIGKEEITKVAFQMWQQPDCTSIDCVVEEGFAAVKPLVPY